jgi:hypothetical protein
VSELSDPIDRLVEASIEVTLRLFLTFFLVRVW